MASPTRCSAVDLARTASFELLPLSVSILGARDDAATTRRPHAYKKTRCTRFGCARNSVSDTRLDMTLTAGSRRSASFPLDTTTARRCSLLRTHPTVREDCPPWLCAISAPLAAYDVRELYTQLYREVPGHSPFPVDSATLQRRRRVHVQSTGREDSGLPPRAISVRQDAYEALERRIWQSQPTPGPLLLPRDFSRARPPPCAVHRTTGLWSTRMRGFGAPGRVLATRGERPGGFCSHGLSPASRRILQDSATTRCVPGAVIVRGV